MGWKKKYYVYFTVDEIRWMIQCLAPLLPRNINPFERKHILEEALISWAKRVIRFFERDDDYTQKVLRRLRMYYPREVGGWKMK